MSTVSTAPVVVQVTGVSKTFGDQRALDDVSLSIRGGQVHALVGENGSGKSTLIKILAGYYLPDPGCRIEVAGDQLPEGSTGGSHRAGLRFVHQNLGLIPDLSAADNFGLAAGFATRGIGRVDKKLQRTRTAELVARVGLQVDVDARVGDLRPVERAALAIARAVDDTHGELRLLVLDEPTAALPPTEVEALFGVIRDLVVRGVAVLYVSHRLDEVLALADEVSVLRDGRNRGTFPARELNRGRIVAHILGNDPAAAPVHAAARVRTRASGPPAVTVENLRTRYLNDLTFEVGRGEIVGVAGLDGSGRDELAPAMGGAIRSSGTVTNVEGRRIKAPTPRQARRHGIALVLANWHPASAVREFDVRENLTLASLHRLASGGVVRHRRERAAARRWIDTVDIRPKDSTRRYALLSGGNQQKVIVARWLATEPSLLVLDDPTSGVDVGARAQLYDLIREQAARGVGVLLCSSDLEDLVTLCDRVICLAAGRIAADLDADAVSAASLLTAITRGAEVGERHPVDEQPEAGEAEETDDHSSR